MKRIWKSVLFLICLFALCISSAVALQEAPALSTTTSVQIDRRNLKFSKAEASKYYTATASAFITNDGEQSVEIDIKLTLFDTQGAEIQQDHSRLFLRPGNTEYWTYKSFVPEALYPLYNSYTIEIDSITPVNINPFRCDLRFSKVQTSQYYTAVATAHNSNDNGPDVEMDVKLTLFDAQGEELQQDHSKLLLPSGWSEIWSYRSDLSEALYPRYNSYSIEVDSMTLVETEVRRNTLKCHYELKSTDPVIVYYEVINNTTQTIPAGDIRVYLVYVGSDGSTIYSQTITVPIESPVHSQETVAFYIGEDEELSTYLRAYDLDGLFALAYFDQSVQN